MTEIETNLFATKMKFDPANTEFLDDHNIKQLHNFNNLLNMGEEALEIIKNSKNFIVMIVINHQMKMLSDVISCVREIDNMRNK